MGIASERYVSFTSYRRNGDAVSSPVWIAPLPDGRVGFTTDGLSGKFKRLRANGAVTLRPCDMRGRVDDSAPAVGGMAVVVTEGDDDYDAVTRAVRAKYGLQFTLVEVGGKVKRMFGKGRVAHAVVVELAP